MGKAQLLPKTNLNLQLVGAFLATLVTGSVVLVAGVILGVNLTTSPPEATTPGQWFPCQEDELLGYTPEAPSPMVACIHIDKLKEELAAQP